MSYGYVKDVPKILATIEQAQHILHDLQWELEKARDKEARRKVIEMINSITEMWIQFSESQSSECKGTESK